MWACKSAGAKRAVRLAVSAPFHCALMMPAQERLAAALARVSFRDPAVPLVNNVEARPVRSAAEAREGLVRQVSAPVRWQECAERLVREGVDTFVEVGAGTVLSGLLKKIAPGTRVLNVQDPGTLDKTVAELRPAAVGGA
jgi:[acyl-carrier-protein] S-malonyltransferase